MKKNLNRTLQYISIALLVLIFFGLGKWQLNRASEWQRLKAQELSVDSTVYPLAQIAKPSDTLNNKQTRKIVQAAGHYIATFRAPGQIDAEGNRDDWEVALMEVQGTSDDAILVVRGLWAERLVEPQLQMSTLITVTGSLQPHQNEDHAARGDGVIQRLDSALITSHAQGMNVYDGYIAAQGESYSGGEITRTRVTPPFRSAVPGFYWQHISYVIIWWLMAAIVAYLPFYNRRITRTVAP